MSLVPHPWEDVPLEELSALTGRSEQALEAEQAQSPPGVRRVAFRDGELEAWVGSAVLATFPRENALLLTRLVHGLGSREEVLDAGLREAERDSEVSGIPSVRILIPTGQDSVWRSLERRGFTVAGRWEVWRADGAVDAGPVPDGVALSTLDEIGDEAYLDLANSCFARARGAVDVSIGDWRIFRQLTTLDPKMVWVLSDREGPCAYLRGVAAGREAEVAAVGALPRARRRGLGRWLLRHASRCLLDNGTEALFLKVWSGNIPARQLYQEEGWIMSGAEQVELERSSFPAPGELLTSSI